MKIIFAGTPDFAARALAALHAAGHHIALVLTQPDRPAGRGLQVQPSAVKQFALAHDLPIAQPTSLKLDGKYPHDAKAAHELIAAAQCRVMVVAAYGLILPRSVLQLSASGCLNIHASLLPRWRGAAPIHRAIEAGDDVTGVTIMQMDEGLDTGPMLLRQSIPIAPDATTGALHDALAELGACLIVDALRQLEQGSLTAVPQPAEGVTYAAKISKEEATLDFSQPAAVVARKIRAFNPFPGAAASFNQVHLKLWDAEEVALTHQASPGQILAASAEHGVIVACSKHAVRIKQLQKPGGKRLPAADFLQGFSMLGGAFD